MSESDHTARKPRICFVAHNAYGALTGGAETHVGGIERQQALMAKWLARNGHEVTMITWDEGQGPTAEVAGVRVLATCRRDAGLRGLRFFHPRWTALNAALARADADLYYYNLGDLGLGQIAAWTRRHGRKLIFSVASDTDCLASLPALKRLRERVLYRYGLRHCDAVIVQTRKQADLMRAQHGRASTVLAMPCEGIGERVQTHSGPMRVLWIGRISPEKRPDWLLDIAEQLPDIEFEIVGAANAATDYARAVTRRAQGIANVTLAGRIPYQDIGAAYRRATVLCSTSAYEGFPNIFLEAWSGAMPVVATCDPDDLIATEGLGFVGDDVAKLTAALRRLEQSPPLRQEVGLRAQRYFLAHHRLDEAMAGFADFFARCVNDARETRS